MMDHIDDHLAVADSGHGPSRRRSVPFPFSLQEWYWKLLRRAAWTASAYLAWFVLNWNLTRNVGFQWPQFWHDPLHSPLAVVLPALLAWIVTFVLTMSLSLSVSVLAVTSLTNLLYCLLRRVQLRELGRWLAITAVAGGWVYALFGLTEFSISLPFMGGR